MSRVTASVLIILKSQRTTPKLTELSIKKWLGKKKEREII